MNPKFFDLKQEKQDRMINAALKVFALNGYEHASTDEIVKEAGISKGLLFHYFESKIGVYEFVYDYGTKYMTLELSNAINPSETSYFELLRQVEAAKMLTLRTYPYLQMFLDTCSKEVIAEALLAVEDSRGRFESALASVFDAADMDAVLSKKNADKFLKIISYTLAGLMADEFATGSFNAENLYKNSIAYINLIESTL